MEFLFKEICEYSGCTVECYKQYLLYNSVFGDRIVKTDLREVDWNRRVKNSAYISIFKDLQILMNFEKFFARKFDENAGIGIVNTLIGYFAY